MLGLHSVAGVPWRLPDRPGGAAKEKPWEFLALNRNFLALDNKTCMHSFG
jgi:hypothetical protein